MDEQHRIIYKVIQEKEIVSASEFSKITPNTSQYDAIRTINSHIKKDGLRLTKTRDEQTGVSYLPLRNLVESGDDCWRNLAIRTGGLEWSEKEKEDLRFIADRILKDENKGLTIKEIKEKKPLLDRISRLIKHKWLNHDEEKKKIYLGPRFLGQMKRWIDETSGETFCDSCALVVVRGFFCSCRIRSFHEKCYKKAGAHKKCDVCLKEVKSNLGHQKEVDDSNKKPRFESGGDEEGKENLGLHGFPNVDGRMCYMNSVLQNFSNLEEMTNIFLSNIFLQDTLNSSYADLMKAVWKSPNQKCIHPKKLTNILSYFPTFKGRQQDCEEFLLSFLGALQNDDVTKLFQGELSTITRCESCGTKTEREDEFLDLSLPIPAAANVTLENCLDKLTKRTKLVAENKIHCARCGGPRIASQRSVFSKLPNHLIVHLKRSKNEGGRVKKIETHVEVPVSLSMGKYLFRNERSYNLTGGIIHHGRMVGSGHCTAFVKKKSSWYCCNDNHVNPVSLDTVLKSQFYVMFYSYDGL